MVTWKPGGPDQNGDPGETWAGPLNAPQTHQPRPDRAAASEGPFEKDELWKVGGSLSWAGSGDAERGGPDWHTGNPAEGGEKRPLKPPPSILSPGCCSAKVGNLVTDRPLDLNRKHESLQKKPLQRLCDV